MVTQIELGSLVVDVVKKDIKNIHLSVYPPTGRVRISAPRRMKTETIRVFAITKLSWIKQQQRRLLAQERETPREFLDRESHYVWGRRYLLKVLEKDEAPGVSLRPKRLLLRVRPGSTNGEKKSVLDGYYREQLKEAARAVIAKWEPLIGVKANVCFVQRMKTKWGSCNPQAGNIRLNSELAKKPPECLEYIVVHEMVHLLEPTHNSRFVALMDQFLPKWQHLRDTLNQLPVRHEKWVY
jgi:predicted metal-dependent hydrolase